MKLKPLYYVFGTVVILAVILSLAAKPFVKSRVNRQLARLASDDSIFISYESIALDLFSGSFKAQHVSVDYRGHLKMSAASLAGRGIDVWVLVTNQRIKIRELTADDLYVRRYHHTPTNRTSGSGVRRQIGVGRVEVLNGTYTSYDSARHDSTTIRLSFVLDSVGNSDIALGQWTFSKFATDSVFMRTPYYILKAGAIQVNPVRGIFSLDSLTLSPHLDRAAFSAKKQRESDQFEIQSRSIIGEGLALSLGDSTSVHLGQLAMQFNLHAFRDKRLPDDVRYKPLPVEQLSRVPFPLYIDSLLIDSSRVVYEEMGEDAETPGIVTFDDLNATLRNLSSDSSTVPTLTAEARFMNTGSIHIKGQLSNNAKPALLEGNLTNFPIGNLNDMLVPHTGVKIEKGTIARLQFHFWFNNDRSDGQVELSYEDLRVVKLKDDNRNGKNDLVTLLLNFLIRKNKGKWVTGKNNIGMVQYERDKQKGVFNFWWKSLFSGVKSSFLDDKSVLAARLKKRQERENE